MKTRAAPTLIRALAAAAALWALLVLATPASAQDTPISVEVDYTQIAIDEVFTLTVTVTGSTSAPEPSLPPIDWAKLIDRSPVPPQIDRIGNTFVRKDINYYRTAADQDRLAHHRPRLGQDRGADLRGGADTGGGHAGRDRPCLPEAGAHPNCPPWPVARRRTGRVPGVGGGGQSVALRGAAGDLHLPLPQHLSVLRVAPGVRAAGVHGLLAPPGPALAGVQ